jgi:hypothetical protein
VLVSTIKVERLQPRSRHGLKAIVSVPKVANGRGSLRSFDLEIMKRFKFHGRAISILSMECLGGKIPLRGKAQFGDGRALSFQAHRSCDG